MNFFDYELSRTATATPPQSAAGSSTTPEPTLNEEVSQVVGQLGRLWGGFRKQSQVALESARKDLTSVVVQAQKEIGHLAAEGGAALRSATTVASGEGSSTAAGTSEESAAAATDASTNEKAVALSEDEDDAPASGPSARSPSSSTSTSMSDTTPAATAPENPLHTLLARAQATLPELERRLQAAGARAPTRNDLAALRAQADGLGAAGERLLRDAGAYLREAVRVLPPEEDAGEEGEGAALPEVALDGMGLGVVVLPPATAPRERGAKAARGKVSASASAASVRAAAVLGRLRREPEVLLADPAADADMGVREAYAMWLAEGVSAREGGMDAKYWKERVKAELGGEDGAVLGKTRDALVPEKLDADTFWARYFFRVHQVEKDEERRKALLAASGSVEADAEDFSWEDDDDESTTPSAADAEQSAEGARASCDTLLPTPAPAEAAAASTIGASYPSSLVTSPTNTSPRESSDGYDVVSEVQGSPQAKATTKAAAGPVVAASVGPTPAKPATAGNDEEEDDEDEGEEESDWE